MDNNNIIPIIYYPDVDRDKSFILKQNKGISGIYRLNNLITGKSYVGSSVNLAGKFSIYYSKKAMLSKLSTSTSIIYNAILKHDYANFSLDILEYCDINIVIEREQYYMDLLKPEYNILKLAGSRLGKKQSEEVKQLISDGLKGRKFSKDCVVKMKIAAKLRLGNKTSFFGKTHSIETKYKISLKNYIWVKVTDIETNTDKLFLSNVDAANYLDIGESTLRRYKKTGKLFKDKYYITNV